MSKVDTSFEEVQDTVLKLQAEIFRLKSVIENLPGSIYWKDINGVYLGRNTYAMEKMQKILLEPSNKTVVGKTDYDLFPLEIADRYRKHDIEVMQTDRELCIEEPVTLPDGKTIVQLSSKRPLYDEKGVLAGIVGNTVDITNLKEVEAALREATARSEQASLIKTEFMRNMEHDIRTPISGILGMTYLCSKKADSETKEHLQDIAQCAEELLDYCNSILDFSKIESGIPIITEKKFHPKKIVNSVIKIELPAAKSRNLTLKMHFDASIPAVLVGDRYRVTRILINLLSNAIKFTQKGHVALKVQLLRVTDRTALIRFTVEDTGIGIPQDKQEYIFEKFSKLSLSNRGFYRGLGLGLGIVRQYINDLGGEIDLVSREGRGTTFACTVPFKLPLTDDFAE